MDMPTPAEWERRAVNTVDMLRDRLLAVDWNFGIDETREETKGRIALFREFLRRSAHFASGAGTAAATAVATARANEPTPVTVPIPPPVTVPVPWPFFDVAARIDPAPRAPEGVLAEIAGEVPRYPATAVRRTCLLALHFAALQDAGRAPDASRDPFAPLVYMYELGGAFALDHTGAIQIGIAILVFDTASAWLERPEPPGLPAFPDLDGIWRG